MNDKEYKKLIEKLTDCCYNLLNECSDIMQLIFNYKANNPGSNKSAFLKDIESESKKIYHKIIKNIADKLESE